MSGEDPSLPVAADLPAAAVATDRPAAGRLSMADVGVVMVGGVVGTGARFAIGTLVPRWSGVPVATFGINIVGAFLLGVLLELLAKRNLDTGWSHRVRLGVGTGGLGAFTTYSALATDTVVLAAGHPARAAGYALATVVIGAVASIAGIWFARSHQRPVDESARS